MLIGQGPQSVHNLCMSQIDRIDSKLAKLNKKWADMGRAVGVTDQVMTNWKKRGGVSKSKEAAVAAFLHESIEWLKTGQGAKRPAAPAESGAPTHTNTPNVSPGPDIKGRVPLISWTSAGNWTGVIDNLAPGDAEQWVPTTVNVGPHAFALRIRGDSMEPTIPDGAIVIVDPDTQYRHRSVVIVRHNSDSEANCKRLVYEGDRPHLQPDNTRYPIAVMREDAVICGVVRQVMVELE